MSKKLLTFILVIGVSAALVGCTKKASDETTNVSEANENVEFDEQGAKKLADGETEEVVEADALDDASKEIEEYNERSKEVYMSFLAGDVKATSMKMRNQMLDEGMEYSFGEICDKFIENNSTEDNKPSVAKVEYAYIDCGDDGKNELAVCVTFDDSMGEFLEYMVFKNTDEMLKYVASFETYYRYESTLNQYGYATTVGSSGANAYGGSYFVIDADGNAKLLYTTEVETGLKEAVIPGYCIPEVFVPKDYPENEFADTDRDGLEMEMTTFEDYMGTAEDDYNRYLQSYFFKFVDYDGNDVDAKEEYQDLYKKARLEVVNGNEWQKKIDNHEKEMGVTEKIKNAEAPEWVEYKD